MARRSAARPRLIAVDGTRGPDLEDASRNLWHHIRGHKVSGGICRWDASGLFFELRLGKRRHLTLSPRTLILLYAADLAFRVRWEIRPALAQGQIVVASPYVDTAVSFGVASGLPEAWMTQILGFAPQPDISYRAKERGKSSGWKGKLLDGFGEFCGGVLETAVTPVDPAALRRKMVAYLDAREKAGHSQHLSRRTIDAALS
jgi:hypothetical protein